MFLFLFSFLPSDSIIRDRCDVIEFNDVYDANLNHVLRQIIFRDWSDGNIGSKPGWRVRDFRIRKTPWPVVFRSGSLYTIRWHDSGVFREVTSTHVWWTHTLWDTEISDRLILDKRFRRELRRPPRRHGPPSEFEP